MHGTRPRRRPARRAPRRARPALSERRSPGPPGRSQPSPPARRCARGARPTGRRWPPGRWRAVRRPPDRSFHAADATRPSTARFAPLMRSVIAAFLLTRLGLVVAGMSAPLFLALPAGVAQVGPPLLAMWVRWDGPIYITLAQSGYFVREAVPVTAFFPLYPLLMQVLTFFSANRELLAQ